MAEERLQSNKSCNKRKGHLIKQSEWPLNLIHGGVKNLKSCQDCVGRGEKLESDQSEEKIPCTRCDGRGRVAEVSGNMVGSLS